MASLPSTYTLKIQVAKQEMVNLKKSGYRLCIAKKVNGKANVIWKSDLQFNQGNWYKLEDTYKLYAVKKFEEGATVPSLHNTEDLDIFPGQSVTLDKYGVWDPVPPTGNPDHSQSITVTNHNGPVYLALSIKSNEPYRPIYVSEAPCIHGIVELKLGRIFVVWFEQDVETGMMFSGSRSECIKVDFGSRSEVNIHFRGSEGKPGVGKWLEGPLPWSSPDESELNSEGEQDVRSGEAETPKV